MIDWYFTGWEPIVRAVAATLSGYVAVVVLLRVSGKRTLSKMNMFDFVVTIALGSILASTALGGGVPVLVGVTAVACLVVAQFVITWLSVRWRPFNRFVTGEATLLLFRGELIESALRQCRLSAMEIEAAVRNNGGATLEETFAVVLETDGSMSVIGGPSERHGLKVTGILNESGEDEAEGPPATASSNPLPGAPGRARKDGEG
jgi:uncharacterized membrane protein YcaP (DUF421 family)